MMIKFFNKMNKFKTTKLKVKLFKKKKKFKTNK